VASAGHVWAALVEVPESGPFSTIPESSVSDVFRQLPESALRILSLRTSVSRLLSRASTRSRRARDAPRQEQDQFPVPGLCHETIRSLSAATRRDSVHHLLDASASLPLHRVPVRSRNPVAFERRRPPPEKRPDLASSSGRFRAVGSPNARCTSGRRTGRSRAPLLPAIVVLLGYRP